MYGSILPCYIYVSNNENDLKASEIYDFNKDFSSILLKQKKSDKKKFSFPCKQTPHIIQDERRMEEHNVTVVVEFAIALMSVLDQINRESFQRFRLRIGLNHGWLNRFFFFFFFLR